MTAVRRRYLRALLRAAGALTLAVAAIAIIEYYGSAFLSSRSTTATKTSATASAPSTASGSVMSLHDEPRPVPDIRFRDGGDRTRTLAEFRGKVVLLNIWATWCGPCRREMPILDRLQAMLGGPDFEVLALSIDRAGAKAVTEFYTEVGVDHLARYIDESGEAARQLNALGLPTTLLVDREGREIARLVGPAEWDTPEMVAFFERQIARHSGAAWYGRASKWAGGEPACAEGAAQRSSPDRLCPPTDRRVTSSAISEGSPS